MNQAFVQALERFSAGIEQPREIEQQLMRERDLLAAAMRRNLGASKVAPGNPLLGLHELVRKQLEAAIDSWARDWDAAAPMRQLAEAFGDRIVLLVFGKVNVGKSSFCNLFASLHAALGPSAFFRIEEGERVPLDSAFEEGATETTSRIQGVELGSKLVLLDSPGLHSVTPENGELTRRFTDSADAVIWLTSSGSPGQVQELDDLKEEFERNKPLLPVIGRSDEIREDEDPETGELVRVLRPKSAAVRKQQEDDVAQRVRDKLGEEGRSPEALRKPLSMSVRYYKENPDAPDIGAESGLANLFAELATIVDEARVYKAGKANQMVRNYVDGAILRRLEEGIEPEVRRLAQMAREQERELDAKKSVLASEVLADLLLRLPDLIEEHKADRDVRALGTRLSREAGDLVSAVARRELERYVAEVDAVVVDLGQHDLGQFEERTVAVEQRRGSMWQAAGGAAGAATGAGIGSLLLPGPGTVIGALIGGLFGSAGGSYMKSTETIRLPVGVSAEEVQLKCEQALRQQVPRIVDSAIDQCIEAIRPMHAYTARLAADIETFRQRVDTLRGDERA